MCIDIYRYITLSTHYVRDHYLTITTTLIYC